MRDNAAVTATVVVVEDDQSVREMLAAVLRAEGYAVRAFEDAETAIVGDIEPTSVLVLDVGLPRADGFELCGLLRARGHDGGILMLTARHEVADRVVGLDAGADDYLVKPFALDELLARVRALARRSSIARANPQMTDHLQVGELTIDVPTRRVDVGGTAIELTKIEFDLLVLLVSNAPVVLDREVIHDRIWGYAEELASNTLEVFVSQLRRKLEANGYPRILHTVRGVGYVAREPQ